MELVLPCSLCVSPRQVKLKPGAKLLDVDQDLSR